MATPGAGHDLGVPSRVGIPWERCPRGPRECRAQEGQSWGVLGSNRQSWESWVRISRNRGATSLSSPPAREREFFLQALGRAPGRDVARDFRARSSGRGRCHPAGLAPRGPRTRISGSWGTGVLRPWWTPSGSGVPGTPMVVAPPHLGPIPAVGQRGAVVWGSPTPSLPSPSPASRAHILCPPPGGRGRLPAARATKG